jgi:hypothetical protein
MQEVGTQKKFRQSDSLFGDSAELWFIRDRWNVGFSSVTDETRLFHPWPMKLATHSLTDETGLVSSVMKPT